MGHVLLSVIERKQKKMSIEWVGWCYVGENKILVEGDLLIALKKIQQPVSFIVPAAPGMVPDT